MITDVILKVIKMIMKTTKGELKTELIAAPSIRLEICANGYVKNWISTWLFHHNFGP